MTWGVFWLCCRSKVRLRPNEDRRASTPTAGARWSRTACKSCVGQRPQGDCLDQALLLLVLPPTVGSLFVPWLFNPIVHALPETAPSLPLSIYISLSLSLSSLSLLLFLPPSPLPNSPSLIPSSLTPLSLSLSPPPSLYLSLSPSPLSFLLFLPPSPLPNSPSLIPSSLTPLSLSPPPSHSLSLSLFLGKKC